MVRSCSLLIIILLFPNLVFAHVLKNSKAKEYKSQISPIPFNIQKRMKKYTWNKECPVPLKDLLYIRIPYWGFDQRTHTGALIVNKLLAKELVQIFKSLYLHKFPIQSIELMDQFKGNDDASMRANNTSTFNCRNLTGEQGIFSQHAFGRAIDINPKINPYIKAKRILPSNGFDFANRSKPYPGKITKDILIYKLFIKHGWDWAGNWHDLQDYQHFEKRANGEKRNPYGYH